jgi:hypothetical protein
MDPGNTDLKWSCYFWDPRGIDVISCDLPSVKTKAWTDPGHLWHFAFGVWDWEKKC